LYRGAENEAAPAEAAEPQAPHEATTTDAWGSADAAGSDAHDGQPQPAFDDSTAAEPEPIRPRADPPAYSEWAGVGSGGRDDSDYNLEAFVSAETTLADWLREQLTLAIADPARRMIGQYLVDLVDETGYLTGDLEVAAEKLGTSAAEI